MLGDNLELLFGNSCVILFSRLRLCLSSSSGNRSRVDSAQAGPFFAARDAIPRNRLYAKEKPYESLDASHHSSM